MSNNSIVDDTANIADVAAMAAKLNKEVGDSTQATLRAAGADEVLATTSDFADIIPFCPVCGHDMSVKVEAITDVDKRNWLRFIQGAPLFIKEYDLFGGSINLAFRGLTVKETEIVTAAYEKTVTEKTFGLNTVHDASYWFYRIMFCAALHSITRNGESLFDRGTAELAGGVLAKVDETVFGTQADWMGTLFVDLIRKFSNTVKYLSASGLSSDFWKPTP